MNCVHFHPTISGLLASVSDDCHVKIWRPTEDEAAENSEDEFEFDFPAANVGKIFQKIFLFFLFKYSEIILGISTRLSQIEISGDDASPRSSD